MVAVRAGRRWGDERFVVAEDRLVVEIEVIVTDFLAGLEAFAETVVEGSVQMVVRFPDLDDVPAMAVFDALSGLLPQSAIMHQMPSVSQRILTDLAMPSQTPTPCPRGPMISWE